MSIDSEKRIGNIYGFDGGNYAGNVYDSEKLSPTLRANSGGNTQPMIVDRGGCMYDEIMIDTQGRAGKEPKPLDECPTLRAQAHGNVPMIVASRGRNPDNPSDRTAGAPTEQRLEVNQEGVANCLTSVQKDSMVLENKVCFINSEVAKQFTDDDMATEKEKSVHGYRIRKLTPRSCGRLMGVTDDDITKMEKVNSNSQLYKQFGNSIVCDVLCAMFRNLNITGVKTWNEYLNETGGTEA